MSPLLGGVGSALITEPCEYVEIGVEVVGEIDDVGDVPALALPDQYWGWL
jgi:hypothetical protein